MQTHFQAFFDAAYLLAWIVIAVFVQVRAKFREVVSSEFLVSLFNLHKIAVLQQRRDVGRRQVIVERIVVPASFAFALEFILKQKLLLSHFQRLVAVVESVMKK